MVDDVAPDWIGLRLGTEEGIPGAKTQPKLVEYLGSGSENAVFEVACGDERWVIKVPRTHIGFVIRVPPNELFPEVSRQPDYEARLSSRLQMLQGSPMLLEITPFEELWNALAVQHLSGRDPVAQSVDLQHYDTLHDCCFVRQRLADWAAIEAGLSEERRLEIITIYQRDRPIHADFPEILAQDAKEALTNLSREERVPSVMANPLLPWLAAAETGYRLSTEAAGRVASEAIPQDDWQVFYAQVAEVCRYVVRDPRKALSSEPVRFALEVARRLDFGGDRVCRTLLELLGVGRGGGAGV